MTGMYVSTAYMGYGGRLRSTLPDIVYYDFQIRLLSDLMKLNKEILCKPHPEGRSKVGDLFFITNLTVKKLISVMMKQLKNMNLIFLSLII